MSTQKITKYAIFIITILVASLLSEFLIKIISSKFGEHSYKGVGVEMFITVLVYYPAFTLIEKLMMVVSKEYIKSSKRAVKSSNFGLIIGFAIALFCLFIVYAIVKYNMNPFNDIINFLF